MEKYYWLNKNSRQFLERGYLEEGVTPEQRIRQIAENAEKILGPDFKGFADKFEDYMSRGFYSLSTPVWTNFGNKRGLPVSCVTGDSWINTICGGKQAKDIVVGDKVLTHKGRYRKVTAVIPTKDKDDIYILEVNSRLTPIKITGNHLVKTNLGWTRVDELDISRHLIAVNGELESQVSHNVAAGIKFEDGLIYCPIKSLTKTDLIEDVYDFTVEEDHSFSVSGVVVHNCFGSYIGDTMQNILEKVAEVGTMSKLGGGTSAYFGDLRSRGSKISVGGESSGPVHFMELFDTIADVISQGAARRGSFAAYLPIEHPDIEEFLQIRDEGHPIQNMSIGVTISDKWMKEMIEGDKQKRSIWGKIIKKRFETGYPYIMFSDTVNNNAPQVYKDKGMKIKASNLCSEINIVSDENNSFVCVLSSINLLHWDEIIQTDAIETLIYFLDAVNQEFVDKTEGMKFMETANYFAKTQRALGMGALGWHSLLQSKMIPFESMEAKLLNTQIWKTIRERADKATEELASLLGEPELLKGYGRRNVTTLAVAPTTSSSFILGQVSPSIEPENSCYYVKKLAKGSFTYKNPYLKELLKKYNKNTDEVWKSILVRGGSVQHLDFLTPEEKSVFKTFGEISQKEIIIQNSQRQKYIDQSVSLNIMVPPNIKPKEVSDLLIYGWEMGIKTFYYQRSANPAQELVRSITTCVSCEA